MKSVFRMICADTDPAAEDFFHCGEVTVVEDQCGRYLQAAETPLARFGYRFRLNSKRPHLLRVRYPDNRRRFMTVGDGTSYDASCAIVTGHRWEVSNSMQQFEELFWPRFEDFSLCFMTWGKNEAAAVESFEVFELDEAEIAPLEIMPAEDGGRGFGVQYEDPCGTQAGEGAQSFSEWMERLFTYLRHTGQNELVYPLCWYHGPWFPNEREAAQVFSITVADDRRQYIVWSDAPADWPATLLERCEREKIDFTGEFTLLRLDSLMRRMNIDQKAIEAGAETFNNMLSNNMVQSGTMDWTVVYHSANYPEMLQSDDPFNTAAPRHMAFGEKSRIEGCPIGPMFNVLHPEVQTAVLELFRECCRKYGRFRSFRGITVTMWAPTILWFGSLKAGYDDYSVGLFERETGIEIPVELTDPERFRKRAEFLLGNHLEQWRRWRCEKIAAFLLQLRDVMIAEREDLTLSLTMWNEPFIPAVCEVGTPGCQFGSRASCDQLYLDGGIDLALLEGERNIEVMFQTDGGNRDRTPSNHTEKMEYFYMFRDFDYLDDSVWKKMDRLENSGVYIFNSWHEAWGCHRWFPADESDGNPACCKQVYGGAADGMFRINSCYEDDGFWWDSQLRITPAFPSGRQYMEHLVHALASGDALKITAGGLFLDKVHRDEFREFARIFRRLPRRKFDTVGGSTDPVAVRQLTGNGETFVYCVNREPYSVRLQLEFERPPRGVFLADGAQFNGGIIELGGYGLTAFKLEGKSRAVSFDCEIPAKAKEMLRGRLECALALPALPMALQITLRRLFQEGRYSRLRHMLSSYPVARASEEGAALPEVFGCNSEMLLENA